jgi:geranylgeranyl reductase family protein
VAWRTADADLIIVGAGPAGATAARTLALGGARVTMVDRATFPRNKPCGGAISMRALQRFPYLSSELHRISARLISRLHLESPSGETVDLQSDVPAALMIRRVEFDELLVRLAQQAGATLIEGVEIAQAERTREAVVLITRDGKQLRAPLVIAADGANSVVARRLGMNRGWSADAVALDMMEETPVESLAPVDPDSLWVAYGYKGSHGYAYVFPKRDHVNVGIGYVLDYYRGRVGASPYDLQRRFVRTLETDGILTGHSDRRRFTPALIPVGGPLKRTVADRVMLIGDAGGFVNGFSAEGIYYGMVSGELAARAVLRSAPALFERAWRQEIGAELRDSVVVQRFLFRNPRRIDGMVSGARAYPAVARTVIDYAVGRATYAGARRRLLARFPLLAARLFFESGQQRQVCHNARLQPHVRTRPLT